MQTKSESKSYKGHELLFHEWAMIFKMYLHTGICCSVIQLIVFGVLALMIVGAENLEMTLKFWAGKASVFFYMDPIMKIGSAAIPASQYIQIPEAQQFASTVNYKLLLCSVLSFVAYLAAPALHKIYANRAKSATESEHIRGMEKLTEEALAEQTRKEPSVISFGSVKLPNKYLPEHIAVFGKTRVGKSVTLMQHLFAARQQKARGIVFDAVKAEYITKLYRPGQDFILNPLDSRGVKMSLFREIRMITDVDSICSSLIPDPTSGDPFWATSARAVLRGAIAACIKAETATHAELWKQLTQPTEKLLEFLGTTSMGAAGAVAIQDPGGKQTQSIMAVLMSYVSWLELAQGDEGDFSLRRWLENSSDSFIFITGLSDVKHTLKPYMSLCVDLLSKSFLALPDGQQSLYFFLDELSNLNKLPGLKEFMTAAGSRGATVLIGTQDYAGLEKVYGREDTESIVNSCGSLLALNVKSPATAKRLSENYGQRQYWATEENVSMGSAEGRDTISLVRRKVTEDVVMPGEIMNLPKLQGYLKIPEHNPALVKLRITEANNLPDKHQSFIMRDGLSIESLKETEAKTVAVAATAPGLEIIGLATDRSDEETPAAQKKQQEAEETQAAENRRQHHEAELY